MLYSMSTRRPSLRLLLLTALAVWAVVGCSDSESPAAECTPALDVSVGFSELRSDGTPVTEGEIEVSATVRNTGACPVTDIELFVDGPQGFSESAGGVGVLAAGGNEITMRVEAPLTADADTTGGARFTVRASGNSDGGPVSASTSASVTTEN
jgi:uncharacterized membrane protein